VRGSDAARRENGSMSGLLTVAERAMPELTDEMTVAELVDVLEHMRFPGGQATTLRIDRGVRDYLLRMLRER
jgi:hypothetical protein